MKLNTNFTVAVHTILCIAYFQKDNKVTSDFIAGSTGMNPVIIRKILAIILKNRPKLSNDYLLIAFETIIYKLTSINPKNNPAVTSVKK